MARPFRPNLSDAPKGSDARNRSHPRQETRREAKLRKREEAEARNALTHPEHRRAFRREALRKAAQEASAHQS